jgi:hypothetical protein
MGNKRSFQKLQEARPGVAFYLPNPSREVRLAFEECQFPSGTRVKWSSTVIP